MFFEVEVLSEVFCAFTTFVSFPKWLFILIYKLINNTLHIAFVDIRFLWLADAFHSIAQTWILRVAMTGTVALAGTWAGLIEHARITCLAIVTLLVRQPLHTLLLTHCFQELGTLEEAGGFGVFVVVRWLIANKISTSVMMAMLFFASSVPF